MLSKALLLLLCDLQSDSCPVVLKLCVSLTWILPRLYLCCPSSFICSVQSTFPLVVESPGILNPFWQTQFAVWSLNCKCISCWAEQGYSYDAHFSSAINNTPKLPPLTFSIAHMQQGSPYVLTLGCACHPVPGVHLSLTLFLLWGQGFQKSSSLIFKWSYRNTA